MFEQANVTQKALLNASAAAGGNLAVFNIKGDAALELSLTGNSAFSDYGTLITHPQKYVLLPRPSNLQTDASVGARFSDWDTGRSDLWDGTPIIASTQISNMPEAACDRAFWTNSTPDPNSPADKSLVINRFEVEWVSTAKACKFIVFATPPTRDPNSDSDNQVFLNTKFEWTIQTSTDSARSKSYKLTVAPREKIFTDKRRPDSRRGSNRP